MIHLKIQQLDAVLANKIAAGEVVERPANVVKELVENSIDAASTKIDIIIKEAGLQLIQIIDNGEGMDREDALLCFSRHATSKIKDDNDLFCIQSLGFRGEAIPSIASVSLFTMQTATDKQGSQVIYQYGQKQSDTTMECDKGTNIKVEKLFQNVPARLKYIRSLATEFSIIQNYIEKLSLSHPNIAFTLLHNGKCVYKTNGNGNLLEVIANMYGLEVAKNMIPVNFHNEECTISGYISKIAVNRASKNNIITMVNHRTVRNKLCIDCITQAYRPYLADKRFPIIVINIEVDPYLVDVNVHPAKLEVRFSKEKQLRTLLLEGVEKELAAVNQTYRVENESKLHNRKIESVQESLPLQYEEPKETNDVSLPIADSQVATVVIEKPTLKPTISNTETISNSDSKNTYEKIEPSVRPQESHVESREKLMKKKIFVRGQVHGTYIICQDETGMYLVDQHAAQERINYEYYLEQFSHVNMTMRDILVPITLTYPMSEYMIIEENKEVLHTVGIYLESFGTNGYVVKQLPLWMKNIDAQIFIEAMMERILQGKGVDIVHMQEHAIATLSCKASLKANTHLSTEGMQNIIDTLMRCDNPYVCPHGRPTIIYYSTYEIEKLFKRVI